MKKKNSLALFGQAFKNAKNDFWVSIQVLLVAIFSLAMTTLYGCGSNGNSDSSKDKITVTGGDGKVYESYQECCAANDYEAAHLFLAKLQNSESEAYSYREAKEYIS